LTKDFPCIEIALEVNWIGSELIGFVLKQALAAEFPGSAVEFRCFGEKKIKRVCFDPFIFKARS
jgi:hypothetical protein